jgi:hypothetical protein
MPGKRPEPVESDEVSDAQLAAELRRRGWPKPLRCPLCGQRRSTTSPGDRYHEACRRTAEAHEVGSVGMVPHWWHPAE